MVAPYISDEVKQTPLGSAPATLEVFDRAAVDVLPVQSHKLPTTPSSELTEELDGAAQWLGVPVGEILLAALGRTLGRTRGDGIVAVDVTGGTAGSTTACR